MKKIIAIIGARPQFIKHYPFEKEAVKKFNLVTIHTGQHYDENMSAVFFDQLGMKKPDYLLTLGGGSHGAQTGAMLIDIEKIVLEEKPDALVVYGDTNSTLAGALVAAKLHVPLVHIEAGLRSYNKEMPEEVNRVLTDHISDLLLIPSEKSTTNLQKEGISKGVHIVGDIMKDLLLYCRQNNVIKKTNQDEQYIYVTLHRPYNVDEKERLIHVLQSLNDIGRKIIFAIHPRTRNKLKQYDINISDFGNIHLIDPQGYFENISFLDNSIALITDSGGMQKEAYWCKKMCLTIRKETEWTETLESGANRLLFDELSSMKSLLQNDNLIFDEELYGDGRASEKIVGHILNLVS